MNRKTFGLVREGLPGAIVPVSAFPAIPLMYVDHAWALIWICAQLWTLTVACALLLLSRPKR